MDEHPGFKDSWPSSVCGSSPALSHMVTTDQPRRVGKQPITPEAGDQQDSVLAKYIERFRHGRPQSREERQQNASAVGKKQAPFWWMPLSTGPSSSTPTKTTHKDTVQHLEDDCGTVIYTQVLSDTSQGEFDDTEILQLQERANRLLLRDECSLNDGSIPVSSEGLGCSGLSSPYSVDEPVRQPFIPEVVRSTTATAKTNSDSNQAFQKPAVIPSVVPSTRPEEDILFQWRLRRKMEQAREQHSSYGPTFNWQLPTLSYTSGCGQHFKGSSQPLNFTEKAPHPQIACACPETKETPKVFTSSAGPAPLPAFRGSGSGSSAAQPHVPAHMHFLCDVLPCPSQTRHASTHENILSSVDESWTKDVCKKTEVSSNTIKAAPDEPSLKHMPSSSVGSSVALEQEKPLKSKRADRKAKGKAQMRESEDKKEATVAAGKDKKSTRYRTVKEHFDDPRCKDGSSSRQQVSKTPLAMEQQQQVGYCKISGQSSNGSHVPPSSPVHSALGQVVSEVLFPSTDSSPAQRMPVSTSPLPSFSALQQSSVNPCDEPNSVEVISQLLQEAEDSDEKDFEDDALLKVLRQQRQWVKEQISEVDSLLNNFLDKQGT